MTSPSPFVQETLLEIEKTKNLGNYIKGALVLPTDLDWQG